MAVRKNRRRADVADEEPDRGMATTSALPAGLVRSGLCLFLGGTDTGKTTLLAQAANRLSAERRAAVVDADVGQSHIGPPAAVGWAVAERDRVDLTSLSVRELCFVGAISPAGHLLPMLGAMARACGKARAEADIVLVDTPGFVAETAAKALWWEACRVLRPDQVVAIQKQDELEPLLAGLEPLVSVLRLRPDATVRTKSPEERRTFRVERFTEYFAGSAPLRLEIRGMAVQQSRPFAQRSAAEMAGLLVALRDADGTDRTLGVVTQWDNEKASVTLLCPSVDARAIRCLVVGDAHVELETGRGGGGDPNGEGRRAH